MIAFTVYGTPQPKGSTKAFMRPGMRFPVVTSDNPKLKDWQHLVAHSAQRYAKDLGAFSGAVSLVLRFALVRPQSLPKKVREHLRKPDLDKLVRACKDALKGIVYLDDSQVVELLASKRYAEAGEAPGVTVQVAAFRYEPVLPVEPVKGPDVVPAEPETGHLFVI